MPAMTDHEHETAADKRLYVEIGLVPVSCATCGVEVGVKKNSRKHTSVQWTAAAMAGCAHFDAVGALRRLAWVPAAARVDQHRGRVCATVTLAVPMMR